VLDCRLVSGLYSLGTDLRENTAFPLLRACPLPRQRVLSLLTRQAYSVHVTILTITGDILEVDGCVKLLVFGLSVLLCALFCVLPVVVVKLQFSFG
jgi:hypothetical protein